jgi:hypothetical protein
MGPRPSRSGPRQYESEPDAFIAASNTRSLIEGGEHRSFHQSQL